MWRSLFQQNLKNSMATAKFQSPAVLRHRWLTRHPTWYAVETDILIKISFLGHINHSSKSLVSLLYKTFLL